MHSLVDAAVFVPALPLGGFLAFLNVALGVLVLVLTVGASAVAVVGVSQRLH